MPPDVDGNEAAALRCHDVYGLHAAGTRRRVHFRPAGRIRHRIIISIENRFFKCARRVAGTQWRLMHACPMTSEKTPTTTTTPTIDQVEWPKKLKTPSSCRPAYTHAHGRSITCSVHLRVRVRETKTSRDCETTNPRTPSARAPHHVSAEWTL